MTDFPVCLWKPVLRLLEDLNTPRSLTVKILIDHGEYGQLVNLTTDPSRYLDASDFFRDAQATELLRKCADLPTGIDRQAVAESGFLAAERQCAKTNLRLSPYLYNGPFESQDEARIADFIDLVKTEVRSILGPLPREISPRFGPGATFNDRGRRTSIADKMSSRPTVTRSARCLLPYWEQTAWARSMLVEHSTLTNPDTIPGNRFTTVPKDATKDRGICIEPSLNVFFQLGVGSVIRNRLKRIGINLDTQADFHRRLAREASADALHATLDLSSASDTVSKTLVKLLLPEPWWDLLSSLRSPKTLFKGRWHVLEKFSSMGNGFTFELETLIFASIARVVSGDLAENEHVSVFGDDIIVPSRSALVLTSALRFFGFSLNERKSFTDGYFRESCGGDYFDGRAVRPYYLKEFPNEPETWIKMANGLTRAADQFYNDLHYRGVYHRSWLSCLDNMPSDVRRARGPRILGDLVIHDRFDTWSTRVRGSIRYIRCYRPKFRSVPLSKWKPLTQLACALYGVPSSGVIPRGSKPNFKFGWIPYS